MLIGLAFLEHELGHALGWKHYPQSMHIMHPQWEKGGYDNSGMKNKKISYHIKESYGIFR